MRAEKQYENETFRGLTLAGDEVSDAVFLECEFIDCVFSGVTLRGSLLRDCRFTHCRIDTPKGRETGVQHCEFSDCFLSAVVWHEFTTGNRYASVLRGIKDSTLRYNTFSQMAFPKCDFSGLRIVESIFAECDLSRASFRGTDLDRTEFFRCDLTQADFRDAVGYKVDVLSSKVKGARFSLPEAVSLLGGLGVKIE